LSSASVDERARRRQREVLGDGPRIEPLKPHELDAFALEINDRIRAMANRDLDPKTLDNLPEVIGTMLRHPALFERHVAMGIAFAIDGALPPRDRELAVLRVGWLCGAPYEFGEHVFLARDQGFDAAQIAAVKQGSSAPLWSDHERAVLLAVEELHGGGAISDATWAALAAVYDQRQLIELPMLIGHYQQTAYVQNALRMRLHPGNEGLLAW
jgi:alkylhydroperoxidase family enzyme